MLQAEDFRQESRVLAEAIANLSEAAFDTPTLFKGWTIDDVIGHLHLFNVAALKSLESDAAFAAFFAPLAADLGKGASFLEIQYPWLDGLRGRALFSAWADGAEQLADAFAEMDPKRRLKWAGPEMSALSSVTARQMETWAHGQAVFDVLGHSRDDGDRIRNIAHLGVTTFGWTFRNRGRDMPEPAPHVVLTAPSGTVWEWNDPQDDNRVTGSAVGFCQAVAQTRNVADTDIVTIGEGAAQWMAWAQCFAGPAVDPPAAGTRHVA